MILSEVLLQKMPTELKESVEYGLPGTSGGLWNEYLGQSVTISFSGVMSCQGCGVQLKKTYQQGYCYPCTQRLACCDLCIVKPELCHYAQGTCREPEWGEAHCLQPHFIYVSQTSHLKVGITRHVHNASRWIDQGAIAAVPLFYVSERLFAGRVEVLIKSMLSDRTAWRTMLKEDPQPEDLESVRDEVVRRYYQDIEVIAQDFPDSLWGVSHDPVTYVNYPRKDEKMVLKSLSLDKQKEISGRLIGIKGQYLILDSGVFNVRKHTGYRVTIELGA